MIHARETFSNVRPMCFSQTNKKQTFKLKMLLMLSRSIFQFGFFTSRYTNLRIKPRTEPFGEKSEQERGQMTEQIFHIHPRSPTHIRNNNGP